jgi:hypothetical protein
LKAQNHVSGLILIDLSFVPSTTIALRRFQPGCFPFFRKIYTGPGSSLCGRVVDVCVGLTNRSPLPEKITDRARSRRRRPNYLGVDAASVATLQIGIKSRSCLRDSVYLRCSSTLCPFNKHIWAYAAVSLVL